MTITQLIFPLLAVLYLISWRMHAMGRQASAKAILAAGALLNALFLLDHAVVSGVLIGNSLLDPPFFIPLAVAVTLLAGGIPDPPRRSAALAFLLLAAAAVFAALYPRGIIPPAANKTGTWPFLFFFFENCAYALFAVSGALAAGARWEPSTVRRVRRLVILGFISFSIAQVVGAAWSFLGWGHPFMWGSRHLTSAAVWLFYAALVHLRFLRAFAVPERWLTAAGALLAVFVAYSHLVLEMGIQRIGG